MYISNEAASPKKVTYICLWGYFLSKKTNLRATIGQSQAIASILAVICCNTASPSRNLYIVNLLTMTVTYHAFILAVICKLGPQFPTLNIQISK